MLYQWDWMPQSVWWEHYSGTVPPYYGGRRIRRTTILF